VSNRRQNQSSQKKHSAIAQNKKPDELCKNTDQKTIGKPDNLLDGKPPEKTPWWTTITTSVTASVVASLISAIVMVWVVRIPEKVQWDLKIERKKIALSFSSQVVKSLEKALESSEAQSRLIEEGRENWVWRSQIDKEWPKRYQDKLDKLEKQNNNDWIEFNANCNALIYYSDSKFDKKFLDKTVFELIKNRSILRIDYRIQQNPEQYKTTTQEVEKTIAKNQERIDNVRSIIKNLLSSVDTSLE
jgi:hypothetical protein